MPTEGSPRPLEGLRLMPLGLLARPLVEGVLMRLSRRLSVPCRHVEAPRGLSFPRLVGREQLDADEALRRLEWLGTSGLDVLVGLTSHDIGNPIFTFFFGRARRGGGAALVSVARLRPGFYGLPEDAALTAMRSVTEILHELGHVAGLAHCEDAACLMRFCTSVGAIDQRGATFCAACSPALPQAFDPVAQR